MDHSSESGLEHFGQQVVPLIAPDAGPGSSMFMRLTMTVSIIGMTVSRCPPLPLAVKLPSGMPSSGCASGSFFGAEVLHADRACDASIDRLEDVLAGGPPEYRTQHLESIAGHRCGAPAQWVRHRSAYCCCCSIC